MIWAAQREIDSEVLCKLSEFKISFETSKLLSNPLLSKTSIFINCQTLQRQVLNLPKQIIMKLFGLSAPEPGTKKMINLQIVENEQSFWLGTETEHTKHWALQTGHWGWVTVASYHWQPIIRAGWVHRWFSTTRWVLQWFLRQATNG